MIEENNGYVGIISKEVETYLKNKAVKMQVPYEQLNIWITGKGDGIELILFNVQEKIQVIEVKDILSFTYSFFATQIKKAIADGFKKIADEKKCLTSTLWLNLFFKERKITYLCFMGRQQLEIDLVEFFKKK